jgi:hypothetical protein
VVIGGLPEEVKFKLMKRKEKALGKLEGHVMKGKLEIEGPNVASLRNRKEAAMAGT